MSEIFTGEFIIAAAGYLSYLFACIKLCARFFEVSVRNEILFAALVFSSAMTLNIAVLFKPDLFIIFTLIEQAVFICLIYALFKGNRAEKFLCSFILLSVYMLSAAFTDALFSALILSINYNIFGNPTLNALQNAAITASTYCFITAAVLFLGKKLESVLSEERQSLFRAETVPLILIVAVLNFVNWGASRGIMVRSGGNAGLFYDQIYSYLSVAALSAICALSATAFICLLNKAYFEQQKSFRYNTQLATYKTLAEQLSRTERLRHDMKNHILALSALMQAKQYNKAEVYIKNFEDWTVGEAEDLTGSKVIDSILYQKKRQADAENIKWECCINIPKNILSEEFDLCIILGNILDNALKACSGVTVKEKCFISLCSQTIKNNFILEVKNGADLCEGNSDRSFIGRGIGLKNVREAVNKLGGSFCVEYDSGVFTSAVLISLNRPVYDG